MQNNEIEKIYSKILDIIKNTNDYCEFFIRDNKFIFQNRTNPKCISIILTDKEILDLKNGIFSERTKYLKELEYMNKIKENEQIEAFKTINEREIFLKSLKNFKKTQIIKYISNYLQDIWKSLFFYSKMGGRNQDNYAITQFIFGLIGSATTFLSLYYGKIPFVLPSIIAGTTPTIFLITKDLIKERFSRIRNYKEKQLLLDSYKVNIDCLSGEIVDKQDYFIEEKNQKYLIANTEEEVRDKRKETTLSEPVYNEIYKLLDLINKLNINDEKTQIILNKIKEIKEEYILKMSDIDDSTFTLENKFTIQNEIIQKLSIIEYELKKEIEKRMSESTYLKELDILNQKIYQLENRNRSK